MDQQLQTTAFLSITSLSRYLVDPDHACGFSGWYPAHFKVDRAPFDNPKWQLNHRALVDTEAAALRASGFNVFIESANAFAVSSKKTGIRVAGTPDIVALDLPSRHVVIIDAKTGTPRPEHVVQVRLYALFAKFIPTLQEQLKSGKELTIDAVATYRSGAEALVPPIDDTFRRQVRDAIALLGGPDAAPTRSSWGTCQFCPVPQCTSRFDPGDASGNDLFE